MKINVENGWTFVAFRGTEPTVLADILTDLAVLRIPPPRPSESFRKFLSVLIFRYYESDAVPFHSVRCRAVPILLACKPM